MSDGKRTGSLVGGLILISIGVLFLLERWYGFFWLWSFVSTWWPLVLILIGLNMIRRYFGVGLGNRSQ